MMRAMRFAVIAAAAVLALAAAPAGDRATFVLHYVQKPIGFEHDTVQRTASGVTLASDFDFTDRGGRVHLETTLDAGADLSPRHFRSNGKTYRFVNVDSDVTVSGRTATVRADGAERTLTVPEHFFTVDGYAPLEAQALLIEYWKRHGRPHVIETAPGLPLNEVTVEARGADEFTIAGRRMTLTQYVVDGVVWGRETIWLDGGGALAAAVTRAGGLSFEAVREDLEPALVDFVRRAARDRIADLARLPIHPIREGTYALVGATIVDGTGRAPTADGVLLVRDGRIAAVGPRGRITIPAGVPVVDAAGKTVIPGLWDMHTHVTQVEWAPVYLAAGVTTARDMGNEFDFITAFRDAIRDRQVVGPRLLLAGLVDGGGPDAFGVVYAATPDEARAVVQRYHDAGFAQMKIYSLITPPMVSEITRDAHALGMTVTGHVPNGMTIVDAVERGMDQIAHLAIRGEAGSPEVTHTIDVLKARQTVLDPTQSWNELLGHAAGTAIASFQPGFPKIPAPLQRVFSSAAVTGIDAATARARLDRGLRIVKALHDAGVPVVAGTDEGVPGYSVDREIELYVEAGFTPLAALQAATIVPARAMKLDAELGTIERGKRADLAVLDANPLDDIHNVRKVRWTISAGRMFDAASLWRSVRFEP